MSVNGLQVIQLTNRFVIDRSTGSNVVYRQAWVRSTAGVELVEIRRDLIEDAA